MSEGNTKYAAILIRGRVNTSPDVRKSLDLLRLKQKNVCVVINKDDVSKGMLQRVKDYITYGEVDEDFFKQMLDKRAELVGGKKISDSKDKIDTASIAKEYFDGKIKLRDFEDKKIKPFFRLAPPRGGFERKGIKMPYSKGGVLGYRADKIKDLILKML